jgi:hypothetical protein
MTAKYFLAIADVHVAYSNLSIDDASSHHSFVTVKTHVGWLEDCTQR